MFRYSHIVAFRKKVMVGQGRVSVAHWHVPLSVAGPQTGMIGVVLQSDGIVTLIS